MFKNVASQKIIFIAYDSTTGAPKTGDSANITAYVSKDVGAVTVLADTSATEMDATNAKGAYYFDLAQGETNADMLLFSAKSSTANIYLDPVLVFTAPPNFNLQSIDSNGRVDIIKIAGTTQTARDIGASVLLSPGTGTGQISLASGAVTVGTNSDKTGYALGSAYDPAKTAAQAGDAMTLTAAYDAAKVAASATTAAAIKTKTDQLTFTVANQVDSNAESMNATTINGTGTSGDLWRGA